MTDPREILRNIPVGVRNDDGTWSNKLELVPGRTKEHPDLKPHPGLTVHRLPHTDFVIAEVHYSVDHRRRDPGWALAAAAKYGRRGVRSFKWRQEMEIDWTASSGEPVFPNFDADVHVIDSFHIPPDWPRWIMYDPGGVNPHAVEWWAMDPTPPNYSLYCYRQWYRGLKMPDKSRGAYYLATDVVRVAHELSMSPTGELERIQAIIIDPNAKSTRATSAGEDRGAGEATKRAMTMYEEVLEVCDQLGWTVDVLTGNNLKDQSIDDVIDRLGNYPIYLEDDGDFALDHDGQPIILQDEDGKDVWAEPRLFFFRACRWAIWEIGQWRWAEWSSDLVNETRNAPEVPVDKNDHSMTNLVRLMNWIRRDESLYDGSRETDEPASPTAALLANWRKRRRNG